MSPVFIRWPSRRELQVRDLVEHIKVQEEVSM
jgi:hypothetical protein